MVVSEQERPWIKDLKKRFPDLKICTAGNGEFFLLNLPPYVKRAKHVYDFLEIDSDIPDFYCFEKGTPVIVKTERYYAITFLYFNEYEWNPIIDQGRVFLFPHKP